MRDHSSRLILYEKPAPPPGSSCMRQDWPERSGQEQRRIVLSMANGNLSKRGLDVLNRASEMKSDFDFCGEDGDLPKEMRRFMGWLGDYLRSEDRKSTRLNSSHLGISYAVFCLK